MCSRGNVQSGKYPLGQMSGRGYIQSEKCPIGEIATRANAWSGKRQVGEVSVGELSSRDVSIRVVSIGEMSSREVSGYRFKRACCVEWPFLKPHNFGDNIFSENFPICSKRTLSNIFEIIGNKLVDNYKNYRISYQGQHF